MGLIGSTYAALPSLWSPSAQSSPPGDTVRTSIQGLTLVHFSAQRKHLLWATHPQFSVCREHCLWARLWVSVTKTAQVELGSVRC